LGTSIEFCLSLFDFSDDQIGLMIIDAKIRVRLKEALSTVLICSGYQTARKRKPESQDVEVG
jgi:hypothetical protein